MPTAIAAMNSNAQGWNIQAISAGAGQKPTMPQPMPNRIAPPARRASIRREGGGGTSAAVTARPRLAHSLTQVERMRSTCAGLRPGRVAARAVSLVRAFIVRLCYI